MFKIAKELKIIKQEVKCWSKNHFGNLHNKLTHNSKRIEYVEVKLLANPESIRLNQWMTRLLKQTEKIMLFNISIGENSDEKNG